MADPTTIDIVNPGDAAAALKAALFALVTPDGSALFTANDFVAAIAPYLKTSDAATLYETLSDIQSRFLTIANAATLYETLDDAALHETIEHAVATYATITGVQSAYLPFTGGTITGNLTVNRPIMMDAAATAFRGYRILTSGSLRWNVGAVNPETGENAGSDLNFYAYDDAGTLLGAAMSITRATLDTAFHNRPTFNGNVPWDSANFDPAPYLTINNAEVIYLSQIDAAATYLSKTDAAATYTTPAEINTALATFETSAHAAATYQIRGTISNFTQGNSNIAASTWQSGDGHNFISLFPEATAGAAPASIPTNIISTIVQAGDTALLVNTPTPGGFTIGMQGPLNSPSQAAIRFANLAGGVFAIGLGVRPTFAGNIAWDAGNFSPSSYLTIANAATTYLTQANAATTYETIIHAAATYGTIANLALKASINNPTFTGIATAPAFTINAANATWKPLVFATANSQRWQLGSNNSAETGSNAGSDFDVFCYSDVGAVVGNPIHINRATCVVSFSNRPIFNGQTPYDTGNLPAALTTALAPYLLKAGGTVTGAVQFNAMPTINGTPPVVTDSSADIATTSWVQSAMTARIGTGGPFIPTSGIGMPYDISFGGPELDTPAAALPTAFDVLNYVFARKVVIPAGFAGSQAICKNRPNISSVNLNIARSGSVAGVIGTLTFTNAADAGIFGQTVLGVMTFLPGDVLTIFTTNETGGNPAGISGVILGAIGA